MEKKKKEVPDRHLPHYLLCPDPDRRGDGEGVHELGGGRAFLVPEEEEKRSDQIVPDARPDTPDILQR